MGDDSAGGETDTSRGATDGPIPSRAIVELDHVFEALGDPRRRYVCYTLLEDREWSLADLAMKIAAWENDVPERRVTDHQRDQVYIALYHTHVPKLVDEGVVHFEELTETITPAERADQVLAALRGMATSLDVMQETHARSEMDDQPE